MGEYLNMVNNRYKLSKEQLGAGGLANVFLGYDCLHDCKVAIKISKNKIEEDPYVRLLGKYESSALRSLMGLQNILHMVDTFEVEGKHYLVTELCDRGALSDCLKTKKLQQDQVVDYLKQIVNGYQQIYEAGIIHRDLKPSNILISSDGKLKISDFGFAISQQDLLTQGKLSVGSTYYRAPETLYKFQYSFKSDVWAIGVILYEMLTGRLPWYASDKTLFMKKILKESIDSILPQSISADLGYILAKTLTVNLDDRIDPEELFKLVSQIQLPSPIKKAPRKKNMPSATCSEKQTENISAFLLNHIDFCRLQYQLLKLAKTCELISNQNKWGKKLEYFLKQRISLHFQAIQALSFKAFNDRQLRSYKKTKDYAKIQQIVGNYKQSYYIFKKAQQPKIVEDYNIDCLNEALEWLKINVTNSSSYNLFLFYDHLITVRWLLGCDAHCRSQQSCQHFAQDFQTVDMKNIVKLLRIELKKGLECRINPSHLAILHQRVEELKTF